MKKVNKLTVDYVKRNNLNVLECVYYFDNSLSKENADYILHEYTSYPNKIENIIEQLNNFFIE